MPGPDPAAELREHFNRALEFHRAGRFSEAVAEFDAALRLEPRNAPSHCNRACTLEALGRFAEASEAYKAFLACATLGELKQFGEGVRERIKALKSVTDTPVAIPGAATTSGAGPSGTTMWGVGTVLAVGVILLSGATLIGQIVLLARMSFRVVSLMWVAIGGGLFAVAGVLGVLELRRRTSAEGGILQKAASLRWQGLGIKAAAVAAMALVAGTQSVLDRVVGGRPGIEAGIASFKSTFAGACTRANLAQLQQRGVFGAESKARSYCDCMAGRIARMEFMTPDYWTGVRAADAKAKLELAMYDYGQSDEGRQDRTECEMEAEGGQLADTLSARSESAAKHDREGQMYYQKGDFERARAEWELCKQLDPLNTSCSGGLYLIEHHDREALQRLEDELRRPR